jgi:peptidyl-prolyl cis-trans isomerase B (cyclophilin B)
MKSFKWRAVAFFVLLCLMAGCSPSSAPPQPGGSSQPPAEEGALPDPMLATITMEDGGVIIIELYHDTAPQSVRNFVYLARQGFYDGVVFHRIMKGFMIQGGDPDGTGQGGPGYTIKGEFSANDFRNTLSHERGVVSMARRGNDYDSAGSQFFIVHADSKSLDGDYAAFGLVLSGMDVVDRIAETPVIDGNGTVADADKPVIKSIKIDREFELPAPDKIN